MSDLIRKITDYLLGPEAIVGEPGFDPSLEGIKSRANRKTAVIVMIVCGSLALCGFAAFGGLQVFAASKATATIRPTWTPEATLRDPPMTLSGGAVGALAGIAEGLQEATSTPLPNLLTSLAELPSPSPTPTHINMASILTSIALPSPTPCNASGQALTEVACNVDRDNATVAAAVTGTIIDQSGQVAHTTTVYIYPTPFPPTITPWIITATLTQTPVVITATTGPTQTPVYQVITATPGPTQTPFFWITQPPIVTVQVTQLVTQIVTVVIPQTVVVTATPTDTTLPTTAPIPTETPTP